MKKSIKLVLIVVLSSYCSLQLMSCSSDDGGSTASISAEETPEEITPTEEPPTEEEAPIAEETPVEYPSV